MSERDTYPLPIDKSTASRRPADSPQVALLARGRGTLLGAAVGDALGWPQEQNNNIVGGHKSRAIEPRAEFVAWARYGGGQYSRYLDPVEPGEYSDDTQLIMAVARSVLHGDDWLIAFTVSELPALVTYSRGAGRALVAAARSWARGVPPWLAEQSRQQRSDPRRAYFKAGANGAAMRIVPHVLATFDQPQPVLFQRVVADGISTHGHPRALVGAVLHAAALRALLNLSGTLSYGELLTVLADDRTWAEPYWLETVDESWPRAYRASTGRMPEADWQRTVDEVDQLVRVAQDAITLGALAEDHATLEQLGCFDRSRNGAGTITAVAAAFLASRTAAQPQAGLLGAAFLRSADTDTLASMTASLLGALHGSEWLRPLDRQVQDSQYLISLADALTELSSGSLQLSLGSSAPAISAVETRDLERWQIELRSIQEERLLGLRVDRPHSGDKHRYPTVFVQFVDGRDIALHGPQPLESRSSSTIARWHASFSDGQTGYLDVLTRTGLRPTKGAHDVDATSPPALNAPRGSGTVGFVALATVNLARCIAFYRDVLGIDVERISERAARLDAGVQIWEVPNAPTDPWSAALLTVIVTDVAQTVTRARAANVTVLAADLDRGEARLTDPDGHELRVLMRRAPAP